MFENIADDMIYADAGNKCGKTYLPNVVEISAELKIYKEMYYI